jgi:hypothetical protein
MFDQASSRMPFQIQSLMARFPQYISNITMPGNQGGSVTTRSSSKTMPTAADAQFNSTIFKSLSDDGSGTPMIWGSATSKFGA